MAIAEGVRALYRHKAILALYYLCNLLMALLVVTPLTLEIGGSLNHSLWSDALSKNFDVQFVAEFLYRNHSAAVNMFTPALAVAGGVYLLFNIFLTGGALGLFHDAEQSFFASGARY